MSQEIASPSQPDMGLPQPKHCGRCNAPFECHAGAILQCQCSGINLPQQAKSWIAAHYTDCLCRSCLLAIAREHDVGANINV